MIIGFDNNGDPLSEWEERDWSKMSTEERKSSIRAEISRLQAELNALEEEERNNTPHKQLNLFEKNE